MNYSKQSAVPCSYRIKQGQIRNEVHRVSTVVIITDDDREENVVLEYNCLRLPRVPLRPRDPHTILAVRIEVVHEPYHIVLQISARVKRRRDIHRMALERYQLRRAWERRKRNTQSRFSE